MFSGIDFIQLNFRIAAAKLRLAQYFSGSCLVSGSVYCYKPIMSCDNIFLVLLMCSSIAILSYEPW
jgi:hypothetical protein